jgi:hypothetical protein
MRGETTVDPQAFWDRTADFLLRDPILNNVLVTAVSGRGVLARRWIVELCLRMRMCRQRVVCVMEDAMVIFPRRVRRVDVNDCVFEVGTWCSN